MAKDYKYRTENSRLHRYGYSSDRDDGSMAMWRWMLITALIIGFVVFLFYLGTKGDTPVDNRQIAQSDPARRQDQSHQAKSVEEAAVQKAKAKAEPQIPQFEFYTVLTGKEAVVPDHEIDTRSREERVGKARTTRYHLQAGSYKDFDEADQLRASLALMGIESRIEKAKVGDTVWHLVKIGPYTRMASIDAIRARLRENGIDAIVIEPGE